MNITWPPKNRTVMVLRCEPDMLTLGPRRQCKSRIWRYAVLKSQREAQEVYPMTPKIRQCDWVVCRTPQPQWCDGRSSKLARLIRSLFEIFEQRGSPNTLGAVSYSREYRWQYDTSSLHFYHLLWVQYLTMSTILTAKPYLKSHSHGLREGTREGPLVVMWVDVFVHEVT